jgi:hypothetical protein
VNQPRVTASTALSQQHRLNADVPNACLDDLDCADTVEKVGVAVGMKP